MWRVRADMLPFADLWDLPPIISRPTWHMRGTRKVLDMLRLDDRIETNCVSDIRNRSRNTDSNQKTNRRKPAARDLWGIPRAATLRSKGGPQNTCAHINRRCPTRSYWSICSSCHSRKSRVSLASNQAAQRSPGVARKPSRNHLGRDTVASAASADTP